MINIAEDFQRQIRPVGPILGIENINWKLPIFLFFIEYALLRGHIATFEGPPRDPIIKFLDNFTF